MSDRLAEYEYFLHGGDYSPEQWKDSEITPEEDFYLQRLANCNTFTIGMFAWSDIEKEEGVFDFSLYDKVINMAYENGTRIILATPSGARPRWLAEKYPEVLRTRHDNVKEPFNTRHNHCFTSPVYREKVRIFNEKLAERYAGNPAVIAWHISNEYSFDCCCPLCIKAFREYLSKKFDNDIEKLNKEYCTSFWGHKYRSFEEIENPFNDSSIEGMLLDWRRFSSEQTVDFMNSEIRAIEKYGKDIPITTNMMPGYYHMDYTRFKNSVDMMSVDSYPQWNGPNHVDEAVNTAFWFSYFYNIKQKPFLLMESVPGAVSWRDVNKLKTNDTESLSAIQAIASGSDSVLYFQWRKSRGNYEKFHGAVVDHYGKEDTRIFRSVSNTGKLLEDIKEIKGATVKNGDIAILYDIESRWAFDESRGYSNKDKGYMKTCLDFYKYFWKNGIGTDVISKTDDFTKYKLVVLPMLYMTDESLSNKITDYVKNGGYVYANLVLGTVNENDLCYLGGIPAGELKNVFGIRNEEIDSLYDGDDYVTEYNGKNFSCSKYAEHLIPYEAKVLAEYTSEVFGKVPAVTVNEYGNGKAYYQAVYEESGLKESVLSSLIKELGIKPYIIFDAEKYKAVTACVRIKNKKEYMFVQNFGDIPAENVKVAGGWSDFFTGEKRYEISVNKNGYRILTRYVTDGE